MTRASMLPLLVAALLTGIGTAAAFNTFDYFTKKPTFDPPENCTPTETNYGVTAQCETRLSNGGYFWATIDTAVAWYRERTPEDAKEFARSHVAEARQGWIDSYPGKKVNFSSTETPMKPAGAPGIACFRYSISVNDVRDDQDPNLVWNTQLEGLACGWPVENPPPDKQSVEMFWLDVFDVHPSHQAPLPNFQDLAQKIFNSARL